MKFLNFARMLFVDTPIGWIVLVLLGLTYWNGNCIEKARTATYEACTSECNQIKNPDIKHYCMSRCASGSKGKKLVPKIIHCEGITEGLTYDQTEYDVVFVIDASGSTDPGVFDD